MSKCVQCNDPADMHIGWNVNGNPQECDICSSCLSVIFDKHKHTQFGQSLIITPVGEIA